MLAAAVAQWEWRHLLVLGPAGGDQFRGFRRAATHLHYFRVMGIDLIQPHPDQPVVVEIALPLATRDQTTATAQRTIPASPRLCQTRLDPQCQRLDAGRHGPQCIRHRLLQIAQHQPTGSFAIQLPGHSQRHTPVDRG